jgi:hypothetical protein
MINNPPLDEGPVFEFFCLLILIFLIVGLLIAFISVALKITGYILKSIGLYTMANKRDHKQISFWAWIPVGQDYMFGFLAKDADAVLHTGFLQNMHIILPIAGVIFSLLSFTVSIVSVLFGIPLLGWVFTLILLVLQLLYRGLNAFCLFGLLKCYDTKGTAVLHAVLSVFIPYYASVVIFIYRNKAFALKSYAAS